MFEYKITFFPTTRNRLDIPSHNKRERCSICETKIAFRNFLFRLKWRKTYWENRACENITNGRLKGGVKANQKYVPKWEPTKKNLKVRILRSIDFPAKLLRPVQIFKRGNAKKREN